MGQSATMSDDASGETSGPFSVAPDEDLLYSLAADGSRRWIDPLVTKGRYWRLRLWLGWFLIAIFLGLPHVTIGGKPGILLDASRRQFTFFGATFHPTDNLILLAFGFSVGITLFALTALYGRLWCGYGCPHLIYLEFLFRPIERWLEGRPATMRKRDRGPWTMDRALRKGAKWAVFAAISVFLSATFVSYFVGWSQLWSWLLTAPSAHRGAIGFTAVVAALVFFDFAYFRDQMCTIACPWGRLQTVLYDRDTIIVGYDEARGEPRWKGRKPKAGENHGDCVDCGRCVTTCPTGVDIRRGLQMECVGCAQCIEACDEVMEKMGKPRGLVRYTSLSEIETGKRSVLRPRVFVYGALMLVAYAAFVALTVGRGDADAEILRGGREPFRMLPTGQVANLLRVRLTNHRPTEQAFTVRLVEPPGAELVVSRSPFVVAPDGVATLDVVVKLPRAAFSRGQARGHFVIESDAQVEIREEFVLLGPYQ